ncbi:MAG: hypothetical protein IJR26_03425 [Bacteroidales bacterium]|nr:hypothetical protein [Bacteroidales bacterium]
MKRRSIIIFFSLLSFVGGLCAKGGAEEAQEMFQRGNAAYDSGDYQGAAELYEAVREAGWQSWELHYNMGNAYYRLEEMGPSVLNYERALRLAPNKRMVKENLALARSKTVDNIEELPRMFLVEWGSAVVHLLTPRGWRTVLVVLIALLSAAGSIFFISKDYRMRRWTFIAGAVLLVLIIISAVDATIAAKNVTYKGEAIVMEPLLVVKGSPDPKSVDKFVLHEGTKVRITERQDKWWHVEIADGKNGWIAGGAEEI